ncbi:pentafunctional AROM polypeptide [Striga asiatica]|uniref:Pentafunctional AROM polypeptide n=1 Tax=Striga asiatica TaxID=4170 RepID=A0A5A7REC3_STRAF|nr:pentafunctional AROM polypeptide [Striga asiatica]
MAIRLLARRTPSTVESTSVLFRSAFSFLRNLSTATSTENSAVSAAVPGGGPKKPKRKKKKNLFEVAQFLPNWGIGYHMAKTHWTGVSYEITKINLYKDGRHGKAWGIVHKDVCVVFISDMDIGIQAADAPKKISGVHKRCWKYIPCSEKTEEIASEPKPEPELQTA